MKVVETNEQAPGADVHGEQPGEMTLDEQKQQVFEETAKALADAADSVGEKKKEEDGGKDGVPGEPLSVKLETDPDQYVESNKSMSSVKASSTDRFSDLADDNKGNRVVEISEDEKNAFIQSVVTGERYSGKASLFGGRITVVFRSRAAVESEAIDSFLRYRGLNGIIKNSVSYTDALRFCILAAGVESVNEEHFPTLMSTSSGDNEKMFYRDTKDGTEEPCWIWLFNKWRDKQEYLVASILNEYFTFEAKYWKLIERSSEENFWNPGGSTGK